MPLLAAADAHSYAAGMRAHRELIQPPPMQLNARRVALVGTIIWFAAFVALAAGYGWLSHHGHRIWLWTALAGWLLGIAGYLLTERHRRQGRTS